MNAGKAVYGILSANSGVTDIVGTRIFPEIAEQEAVTPFIVYQLQSVDPEDTHDGPSKLDEVRFEFLCYADSYNAAADLGVAVRAALDRVSGTYNGVNVESVQFNDVDVDIEYDPRRYSQVLKFTFRIKRDDIEIALGTPVTGAQLGDLSDVNVDGVADGNALVYDQESGDWIPGTAGSALIAGAEIDITEVNGYSIISVEPDLAVTSLTTTGQGTIGGNFIIGGELRMTGATPRLIRPYDIGGAAGELIIQSNGNLIVELDENSDEDNKSFIVKNGADVEVFRVDESGVVTVNQAFALPTADGTANQLLKTDGSGTLTFGANLKDLEDVQLNTPSSGALLQYNGTYWAAAALSIPSVPSTYYHNRYATEAETLRAGATETVELYYTAQADGDGLSESASSDTPSAGNVIRRKLYYAEKAQADPDTSGDWTQFADIADDTSYATAKSTLLAYLKERTGGTVPISLKMTWEDVAATSYLLDNYSGAAAAYSLRLLSSTYAGDAINVWNGTSYADIGFDGNGELDTTALATHCGSNDGFIRYWYDQSGNANDATQTTTANMPKIYDGTTGVITENGKPALAWQNTNSQNLVLPTLTLNTKTVAGVFTPRSGVTSRYISSYTGSGSVGSEVILDYGSTGNIRLFDGETLAATATSVGQLLPFAYRNSSEIAIGVNGGTLITTATSATSSNTNAIKINDEGGIAEPSEYHQEVIIWNSDQSSNRTNIENNINTFYSIY